MGCMYMQASSRISYEIPYSLLPSLHSYIYISVSTELRVSNEKKKELLFDSSSKQARLSVVGVKIRRRGGGGIPREEGRE